MFSYANYIVRNNFSSLWEEPHPCHAPIDRRKYCRYIWVSLVIWGELGELDEFGELVYLRWVEVSWVSWGELDEFGELGE